MKESSSIGVGHKCTYRQRCKLRNVLREMKSREGKGQDVDVRSEEHDADDEDDLDLSSSCYLLSSDDSYESDEEID